MIKQFWQLIPHRLFYFLVGGLIFSYLATYTLNYLTEVNNKKINDLKSEIEDIQNQYSQQLRTEAYQALMHFISLKYLLDQKKSILFILQEPPKYLPKVLKINSVSINNNTKEININGQVEGWINYARIVKYFDQNKNLFKDFKINNFSFDQATGLINLNISFIFNLP
jgi:hypothetical protein